MVLDSGWFSLGARWIRSDVGGSLPLGGKGSVGEGEAIHKMPPTMAKPSDKPLAFPKAGQRDSMRNVEIAKMARPVAPRTKRMMPRVCMS
jgi:hypothetical protein